jgi:hypothetical protein
LVSTQTDTITKNAPFLVVALDRGLNVLLDECDRGDGSSG